MINPCKDCTRRTADCHVKCKDYLEWKEENDRKRDMANKYRAHRYLFSKMMRQRIKRD